MSQIVTVMRKEKLRRRNLRHDLEPRQRSEDALDREELSPRDGLRDPLGELHLQPNPGDEGDPAAQGAPEDPLHAALLREASAQADGAEARSEGELRHPGVPSGGRALPSVLLQAFERVFSHPLGHVVLHEGTDAAERAASIDAEAYTVGNHIVLGRGAAGAGFERLLAHELTHVVQADEGRLPTTGPAVVDANHPTEREAYRNERKVVSELQQAKRQARSSGELGRGAGVDQRAAGAIEEVQASLPGVIGLVDAVLAVWSDLGTDANGEVDALGRELRGLLGDLATGLQQWADPLLRAAGGPETMVVWAEALVAELAGAIPQLQPLMAAIAETSLLDVILGGSRVISGALAEGGWELPSGVMQLAAGSGVVFDDDPARAAQTAEVLSQMARALGPDVANVEVHTDALGKQRASQHGAMGLMEHGVVYLDPSYYDPGTCQGIELLAHEIAHVVQASNPVVQGEGAGVRAESEADSWAASFAAGSASVGLQEGLPAGHVAAKPKGGDEVVVTDSTDETEKANADTMLDDGEADCDCGPNPWDGVHENNDEDADHVEARDEVEEDEDVNDVEVDTEQQNNADVESGDPTEADPDGAVSEVDAMSGEVEALDEQPMEPPETAEELSGRLSEARALLATLGDPSLVPGSAPTLTAPPFESTGDGELDKAAQLEADQRREASQSLLSGFLAERGSQIAEFVAIGATIDERMNQAAEAAMQMVRAQVETQKAAVSAHIEAMRSRATTEAEAVRALINGAHDTTASSAQAVTAGGKVWADSLLSGTLGEMDGLLSGQKATIEQLYTKNDQLYRAAGKAAGDFAIAEGKLAAEKYRDNKTGKMDSILDGYLTDRRWEARAKAAEQVSEAYSAELIKKANEQADKAMGNKSADIGVAERMHSEAAGQLRQMHEGVTKQLDTQLSATNAANEQSRAALLAAVDSGLSGAIDTLNAHEAEQIGRLDQAAEQMVTGIEQQRDLAALGYQELAAQTAQGLVDAMVGMGAATDGSGAPDPAELGKALATAGGKIDEKLAQVTAYILGGLDTAASALGETATRGVDALGQMGNNAMERATSAVDSLSESFAALGDAAWTASSELQSSHSSQMVKTMTDAVTGFGQVRDGLKSGYEQMAKRLEEGAQANAKAMEDGLRKVVTDKMGEKIRQEAETAAAKEQPAWKSVVKWVLIIAIILVVAFVLGPLVIGAVTGLATAAGASALVATFVGAIVGGAIVGAVSGAAMQLVNNWAAGDDLTKDLWTSIWKGAVGGAIGGAVGTVIGPAVLGLSKIAVYGISVASDVIVDTVLSLATGTFSWEGFVTTLVGSLVLNGASNFVPSVGARQSAAADAVNVKLGGRPDVDVSVKPGDVNAPKVDVDAPKVDVDAPKVDVDAPKVDVDAPKVDVDAPTVKVDEPTVKVDEPTVKVDEPTVKVDEPTVKVDEPTVKVGQGESSVDLTAHRKDHILNGHRGGTGKPGKTEFPADWPDGKILDLVSDVATDPNATRGVGKWDSPYAIGIRDGIEIRVDFYPSTHPKYAGMISTAYPINVPPNPTN